MDDELKRHVAEGGGEELGVRRDGVRLVGLASGELGGQPGLRRQAGAMTTSGLAAA